MFGVSRTNGLSSPKIASCFLVAHLALVARSPASPISSSSLLVWPHLALVVVVVVEQPVDQHQRLQRDNPVTRLPQSLRDRRDRQIDIFHGALLGLCFCLFSASFCYTNADTIEAAAREQVAGKTFSEVNEEGKFAVHPSKPFFKKPALHKIPSVKKPFTPKPIFKKPIPPYTPIFKKPHPTPVPVFKIPLYKKPVHPPVPVLEEKTFLKKPLFQPVPKFKRPLFHPIPVYKKPLPHHLPAYKHPIPVYKKPFPHHFPSYKKPIPVYKKPLSHPIPVYKKPFPSHPFLGKPLP